MSEIETKYEELLSDQPSWIRHFCSVFLISVNQDQRWDFKSGFVESVKPGADLNDVRVPLLLFMQRRNLARVERLEFSTHRKGQVSDTIKGVIKLLESRASMTDKAWDVLVDSAREAMQETAQVARVEGSIAAGVTNDGAKWAAAWAVNCAAWSAFLVADTSQFSVETITRIAAETARSATWITTATIDTRILEQFDVSREAARGGLKSAVSSAEWAAIAAEFLRLAAELSAAEAA